MLVAGNNHFQEPYRKLFQDNNLRFVLWADVSLGSVYDTPPKGGLLECSLEAVEVGSILISQERLKKWELFLRFHDAVGDRKPVLQLASRFLLNA